jgi:hypothetical protein
MSWTYGLRNSAAQHANLAAPRAPSLPSHKIVCCVAGCEKIIPESVHGWHSGWLSVTDIALSCCDCIKMHLLDHTKWA